ncbi:MAG: type VI secretion system baseplate subunit TssG [Gemmobacter sp.]|nr:type VI secretion system baseplate subunit TssG [Gemmobacter sp.]
MATADGSGPDDLTHYERFSQSPQVFHIFQAMRVLEARFSDAPAFGQSRRPKDDPVRLGQEASLAFARTTIAGYTPPGAGPGVLTNRFFGLFGPNGPLPSHLTEYAHERAVKSRDPTFVAFADMMTHRMMSLLYRAWVTGQPTASLDRGEGGAFDGQVMALAGYAGTRMRDRDAMPDMAKRFFAGQLAAGPKSAEGLVAMLSAFFRAPVRLHQFVGSWLDLEPDDRWRLGSAAGLGRATSIGDRVWTRSAKFRLRVGPLGLDDYRRLLPGSASLSRLTAIVRNHVGDALDWDVNIVLRGDQVPLARLGADTRLGHTSWLGTRQSGGDADDLYLSPQHHSEPAAGVDPAAPQQRDFP